MKLKQEQINNVSRTTGSNEMEPGMPPPKKPQHQDHIDRILSELQRTNSKATLLFDKKGRLPDSYYYLTLKPDNDTTKKKLQTNMVI